jgi:hypothetical protein
VSAEASTPDRLSIANPQTDMTMQNCGDGPEKVLAHGTDATGAPGTWQLTDEASNSTTNTTCDIGSDLFRADVILLAPDHSSSGGRGLVNADRPLLGSDGTTPFVLDRSATQPWIPEIEMPCSDSAGVGDSDPMTVTITLTAVAP